MIDIKLFKEKPLYEKLKISLFNLPPEKSFYSGSAFLLFGIFILISSFYFLSRLTTEAPKKNEQINIAFTGNFKYFLPIYSSSNIDSFVTGLLYSGLLKKDKNSNYLNDLAESVTKDNTGTKITVKLKEKIFFSNKKEITTDDIMFTYELAANILADGNNRVKYEGISFEKIDDKNFIIIFAKNFSNINEILSLGIISKEDYEKENFETLISSEKALYSVTSGIYKIENILKDDMGTKRIELKINNNNYSLPYLKYINITSYKNQEDLSSALRSGGNIDMVYDSNALNKDTFDNEDTKDFIKTSYITPKITALFLNANKKDILAKKKIRESIYYSVNRNKLSSLSNPENVNTFDLLPASQIRNDLDNNQVIEKISTTTINLTIVDNEKQNKIANSLKISLDEMGIIINIVKENQSDVINNIIKNRDFEMLLYTIEINNLEDLYAFWHSTQRNAPGLNITGYTSNSFDKNLNTIKTSSSTELIENSLNDMLREFYDEYPYIPLYTTVDSVHIKDNLNIKIPNQIYNKKDITLDIINWYKNKEKIWPIIQTYEPSITNLYKLIH